jgi:hypothetical protein
VDSQTSREGDHLVVVQEGLDVVATAKQEDLSTVRYGHMPGTRGAVARQLEGVPGGGPTVEHVQIRHACVAIGLATVYENLVIPHRRNVSTTWAW